MNMIEIDNELIVPEEIRRGVADLLGDMPGGFFVYRADADERLVYVNDACLRIFGCKTLDQFKELTGFTFRGMVHEDDLEEIEDSINEQIARDVHKMDYVEYRIVTYDGCVRWIEDYGHYVQTDSGNYFYVFINDATDKMRSRMDELEYINAQLEEAYSREKEHRRLLYVALQQANTANIAKTTFLNNMSHDIRTLLNAVTGYSHLITDHLDDSARVEKYAEKINDASAQLLDVMVETLEVSRFEAGRASAIEERCSLKKIVENVKETYLVRASRKDVSFTTDVSSIVHDHVVSDEQRILQIMEQLVDNAIKYSSVGGSVSLCLEELKSGVDQYGRYRIVVSDTGEGMHKSFVERMFDPFAREHSTTDSGITGTGLGLTIVKHSVDLLSGTIDVDTVEGEGTSISVVFSAKIAEPSKRLNASALKSVDLSELKILLVEDNPLNREIALCMLQDSGVQTRYAVNGKEAVDLVLQSNPGDIDVILMDLQLPVMNGYEATKAIRALDDEALSSIPIIALSADAFAEDRKRALAAGMNAHIAKPLEIDNLKRALEDIS